MGMSFGFAKSKKKNQEPIEYKCDVCGASVIASGKIPRCLGCGKQICNICGADRMICGTDFNSLEKKDQKKIKSAGVALESAKISKKNVHYYADSYGIHCGDPTRFDVCLKTGYFLLPIRISWWIFVLCTVMIFCVFQ